MKGFKYLIQAAKAGDRNSMILVARAFDTGVNLSTERSVWDLARPGCKAVERLACRRGK